MEIPQIFQEVELNTTPRKKNKRKVYQKKGGISFAFLIHFQKERRNFSLFKELIFEQRK